jgi:hypothetical protein
MPEVQTEDMGSTEENNNMEIEKDDTAKSAFKSHGQNIEQYKR